MGARCTRPRLVRRPPHKTPPRATSMGASPPQRAKFVAWAGVLCRACRADRGLAGGVSRGRGSCVGRVARKGVLCTARPTGCPRCRCSAPLPPRGSPHRLALQLHGELHAVRHAQAGARESIQLASGEAKSVIASGMIRSNQLVTSIEAEARSFEAQLPYFRKDPDLFVRRVAADSLRIVLTNANDKFFVPTRADGTSRELRIQLSREPMKATDREK